MEMSKMTTEERTAKQIILEDGDWADCWICRDIFKRRTPTRRYCYHCERGFCEGIHGTFEGKKMGMCLKCYNSK